jgi:uncharacterized alkaline shock family protein YloU
MTTSVVPATPGAKPAGLATTKSGAPALITSEGTTTIAQVVAQKIAGMAATDVSGVYRLGGGTAAALNSLKNRLPGSTAPSVTQGVSVEVGETEAKVEINLVAEYGVTIPDVAAAVRRNVISAVTGMTGLIVTSVDVNVDDVHLPTDTSDEDSSSSLVRPRLRWARFPHRHRPPGIRLPRRCRASRTRTPSRRLFWAAAMSGAFPVASSVRSRPICRGGG